MGNPAASVRTRARGVAAAGKPVRVACPFCALLCDDLTVTAGPRPAVAGITCPRATAGFGRALPESRATVAGRDVSTAEALDVAADILRAARLPLFGGLSTDVDGIRALLALADQTGGVIDHAGSEGAYHNVAVLQSRGWVMSTLTEVRNRADLVIIVGDGIGGLFPRFYDRIVGPAESMFGTLDRQFVFLGSGIDRALLPKGTRSGVVSCPPRSLGPVIGALRARLRGIPVPAVPGTEARALEEVVAQFRSAKYAVIVWAPSLLPAGDGDLIVLSIADLLLDLNATQRCAGLTLAGNEGGQTALSVTAWQTGYPLRVSLATGKPVFDPGRFEIGGMLARGEGDALLWTASIGADFSPPRTTIPTIVLGTPGLTLPRTPEVFIPVGTPGIDHRGDLIRTDSVVTLPMAAIRDVGLKSVASVAAAIAERIAL